jgi:hypothetical protein
MTISFTLPADTTAAVLLAAGANHWNSPDGSKCRFYLNELSEAAGLQLSFYRTGNICSASWRGERVSNGEGGKRQGDLNGFKAYIDANDLTILHVRSGQARPSYSTDYAKLIAVGLVARIRAAATPAG